MLHRIKAPQLRNPHITVRITTDHDEIAAADRLVCHNYIDVGLWQNDSEFRNNKYIHSPARTVVVAIDEAGDLLATVSMIKDSKLGLPADRFQPDTMRRLRANGDRLAEISALAVDKATPEHQYALILFLFKFLYQYSFYYAGIDRFVATTVPKHAAFYESICGFQRQSNPSNYYYVQLNVQLLTAHLIRDRLQLASCYHIDSELDITDKRSFYRFLLIDEHPSLQFPDKKFMRRSREIDWLAQARLMDMPIAI